MLRMNRPFRLLSLGLLALLSLAVLPGCHRSEEDFDDRTLGQRSHVETVQPENRRDIFRP